VVTPAIYALSYDVVNDLEPIALIADSPLLILASNAAPGKDLKSLIDWLKANPGKASVGTAGAGSPQHISGIFFQYATGTQFQFVPYRGSAPALQDLIGGQIDMIVGNAPVDSMPLVREGKIKAYALTSRRRLAVAPDVPTVDEAGLPGFYFTVWLAFYVPKGTPKSVIDKLNAAAADALADANVRARFAELGLDIFPRSQQTPQALGALQKADIERWWPIIKAAGIKAE